MAKQVLYGLKRNGMWLKNVEKNKNYCSDGIAPTMGRRYSYSEFRTIWSKEPVYLEKLTFIGHLQVLFSEYRYEEKKVADFKVVCKEIKE